MYSAFVYPGQVDLDRASLTLGKVVARVQELFPEANVNPRAIDQGADRLMVFVRKEDPTATKGPGDGSTYWLSAVATLGEHIEGTDLPDLRASVKELFPFLPELGAYWLNSERGIDLALAMLPDSPHYAACEELRDTVLDKTVLGHILQEGYAELAREAGPGS
ncbi:hypothetical protein IIA16_00605 [bacterium]|nr:hypothetical protein [bacterium]